MIIAQVCLRLAVLGGSGGGGTTICHLLRIELIRLLIVACGMLVHSLFNGCAKLLDIVRNWNTLSYTPIQSINGWHVRWECWPCKNWDVFSFQELCTDPCNTGRALSCCNMRWWSWMNDTTMGLRISSRYLCAFKMPSIKCTCVRCP